MKESKTKWYINWPNLLVWKRSSPHGIKYNITILLAFISLLFEAIFSGQENLATIFRIAASFFFILGFALICWLIIKEFKMERKINIAYVIILPIIAFASFFVLVGVDYFAS